MPYVILTMLVQLALIVHVVKTGRNIVWVFVLLFFPMIGAVAYLIVELIPGLASSPTFQSLRRGVSAKFNPGKGLRQASRNLAIANTAQHALKLGNELLERSQYLEAREVFEQSRQGLYEHDPELLLGLARAHFGLDEFSAALDALEALKEHNPERTTAEGHLLYARVLEGLGRSDDAISEYEALMQYHSGPEPACRLATILKQRGEVDRARQLFEEVVKASQLSGKHYNRLYREWVAMARDETR